MEGQDPRVLLCEMYGTVSFQRLVSTLQIIPFVHRFTHLVRHQYHSSSPSHCVLPSQESCSSVGSCIVVVDLHNFRHHLFIFVIFVTSLRMLYLFIFVMSLLLHNLFISVLLVGDVGLDELLGRYALVWSTSHAAGDCLQEHLHGTCTTTQAQGI